MSGRTAPGPIPLALGVITDRSSLQSAVELAASLVPPLAEAVILLDAAEPPRAPLPPGVRLHARPMDGPEGRDFGAQRSALQRLARSPWVLQLDTDESVDEVTLARLGPVLRAAERDGVVALGVPRRNRVSGALSDHYPDPQYRLCRRFVRYGRRVHEAPVLLSRARQSRLALGLHIDHHLTRERVARRTDAYAEMASDGARRGDEAALLTPYRP